MKIKIFLFTCALVLTSCANTQFAESAWIDKENEKVLLTIEKENGKFWLQLYNSPLEIVENGPNSYAIFKDQKVPISVDTDKEILFYDEVKYIPVSKSVKGQFTGRWKSESEDTVFQVQIDDNVDLTWDIIKGSNKPIRFYPKRTDTGFHFTFGQETLSYILKDGYIIDANDKKYSKDSDI